MYKLDLSRLSGFIHVFISRIYVLITNIVIGVLLARYLGPEQYGIYAFLLSLVALLSLPASIGVPNLIIRQIPELLSKKAWSELKGVFRWSFTIISILSGVVIFCSYLIFNALHIETFIGIEEELLLSLLLVLLLSLLNWISNFIRGLHHTKLSQLPFYIKQTVFLFILAVIFYFYPATSTSALVIIVNISCTTVAFLICFILLVRLLPAELKTVKAEYCSKLWFRNALSFAFILGLQIINHRADSLMLGFLRTPEEVAYYDVAVRMAELVLFIQITINIVIAPTVSKFNTESDFLKLSRLITKTVRYSILISFPLAIVLFYFGKELVVIVFGNEYINAISALHILIIAHCFNLFFGPSDLVLNMCKKEGYTVKGVFIAAVLNLILNFMLIPEYGIEGACLATAISTMVWNASLFWFARKQTGIDTSIIGRKYLAL